MPKSTNLKIIDFEDASALFDKLRKKGKKIVQCHGDFDLIHPGHILHFEAAKRLGDILCVTIVVDRHIKKGLGRPLFNEDLRIKSLSALESVDYVILSPNETADEIINRVKPDIYCKGKEYGNGNHESISSEINAVKMNGGNVHFIGDTRLSSSALINSTYSVFPKELKIWLERFKKKISINEIYQYINNASKIKTLVIGEAIIDEYVFCDALGRSNKDPILAFQYKNNESYAGGSLAVANHVAGICENVGLLCYIGDMDNRESFIKKSLKNNIDPIFISRPNAPTVRKQRFVSTHTFSKLFEMYYMDDTPRAGEQEKQITEEFERIVENYDMIIVIDYGHGMMSPSFINKICHSKPFLAVNTQANAGNRGFNTISKYHNADYVCLAGHEIALETRLRHAPIQELILEVEKSIACKKFTITLGRDGIIHHTLGENFTQVPAFATQVRDRVGAGDAVLAISSLLTYQNAPWKIVGLVSNLAGARIVGELGNKVALNKNDLTEYITSVLS